ncbi:DUF5708 family protein [Streptomyces venezuelae]|uniref:DUF5708 family protein n=1 Tax=Streptomyces venezuelae TaxID=54571 RepID=UPI00278C7F11|nr:DUF5708 family protein [Streptomyces venezuelae]
MTPASKSLTEGAICAVAGTALFLFTEDVEIPVFTLTKVGAVLMVVGGLQLLYGTYQAIRTRVTG